MRKISIIIPVYENRESLYPTYIHILSVLKDLQKRYDYEFIFINDGSSDGSLEELIKLTKIDAKAKVIDFTRNFGQVSAILAGLVQAEGDISICISADMQDNPALIKDMVLKWEDGFKVVLCVRKSRNDDLISHLGSKLLYAFLHKNMKQVPKGGFDYFLLEKDVITSLTVLNRRNSFLQADIIWLGYDLGIVEYERIKRKFGKSQWSMSKKIKASIDGVISTSYLPIRFMSLIGIIFSLLGFFYAFAVFISWFFKLTPFAGYAPLMIVMLVTGGLIMMMLGILGEYLWRAYDEIMKKPLYVVKRVYKQDTK